MLTNSLALELQDRECYLEKWAKAFSVVILFVTDFCNGVIILCQLVNLIFVMNSDKCIYAFLVCLP